jgi:hypothetical protein
VSDFLKPDTGVCFIFFCYTAAISFSPQHQVYIKEDIGFASSFPRENYAFKHLQQGKGLSKSY